MKYRRIRDWKSAFIFISILTATSAFADDAVTNGAKNSIKTNFKKQTSAGSSHVNRALRHTFTNEESLTFLRKKLNEVSEAFAKESARYRYVARTGQPTGPLDRFRIPAHGEAEDAVKAMIKRMKIEDFDIESEFNKLRQSLIDKYNVDLKVLDVKDQIEKARLVTRASYGNPKFKNFPKNQIGNARVGTLKLVSAAGFLALLGGMAKAKMQSGNEAIVEAEKKEITETAQ